MPLSEENNWETHLPNLPAYKEYKKLDKADITGYNRDKCKNLANSDSEDKKLCNQILKNLSILINEKGKKQKHGCFYFQNWLHEQIKRKYYKGKDKSKKYSIANKLFDLVEEDISSNAIDHACRGNSLGDPETWKKEKDIHDYFENFENIKCNGSDRDECQKYVKYVTYIHPIYDRKTYDYCDDGELVPYCNLPIKCEDKYNTKSLLAELNKKLQLLDKEKVDAEAAALEEEKRRKAEEEKAKQEEADCRKAEEEKAKQEREAQEEENRKKAAAAAEEAEQRLKDQAAAEAREKELAAAAGGQQTVTGETGTLQPETSLGILPRDSPEHAVNSATTYNSGISRDAGHASLAGVPSILESVSDKVDSDFIRNIIMAVAVLGTIFFLFYYNRSSRLEPSSRKRKQKKKLFEHNYYEEYEKELAMYDSEESFLDSETNRLYLNYHPDQDTYD